MLELSRKDFGYILKSLKMCKNDYYRKFKKETERELLILDKPTGSEDELLLIDLLDSYEENFDGEFEQINDITDKKSLLNGFKCLSERQKEVLYYVYVKNLKIKEVAEKLKITRQVTHKIHKCGLEKLKREMEDQSYGNGGH